MLKSAYEIRTLLLNGVSMLDMSMTFVGHVSVKCPIQKVFVRFMTIIVRFQHNFKKKKYINYIKFKFYYINCDYDYKNKK